MNSSESLEENSIVSPSELYKPLFEYSEDAHYLFDPQAHQLLDVSRRLEQLTGYSRAELLQKGLSPLLAPDARVAPEMLQRFETPQKKYETNVFAKNGETHPVELTVSTTTLNGQVLVIGTLRDISARKRMEREMWEKIQELGRSSSRIYALTEKIKHFPELPPALLSITDEMELLKKASEAMCNRQGFGYQDVTFYLLKDERLVLIYSTMPGKKLGQKLPQDHRYVQILKDALPPDRTPQGAVFPLKGHDATYGVVEVTFHPKELQALAGNEQAHRGYFDIALALAEFLGILLQNLRLHEVLRLQSITDSLTGLTNRRHFDAKADEEFQRAARYQRALTLMLIDLDRFKEVNDTYGHPQGDQVLIEVGKVLTKYTRQVDIVCRYGGDEFAILMPETPLENVIFKANTLRREVKQYGFTNILRTDAKISTTLSIGISSYNATMKSYADLVKTADQALYMAKRKGRDQVRVMAGAE